MGICQGLETTVAIITSASGRLCFTSPATSAGGRLPALSDVTVAPENAGGRPHEETALCC